MSAQSSPFEWEPSPLAKAITEMHKPASSNERQITRFDFTYFLKNNNIPAKITPEGFSNLLEDREIIENYSNNEEFNGILGEIISLFKERCSKYCFQLEQAPTTGKLHLQGRIAFKALYKTRFSTIKGKNNPLPGAHWSPTSTAVGDSFSYVMKKDTQILGPWCDESFAPPFIPRDIKEIKLRPFQRSLSEIAKTYEARRIDLIYDPTGNMGKSTFARWLKFNMKGVCNLPPFNDCQTLIQSVCSAIKQNPSLKCFIADLPRAMNKEKLGSMYAALEATKNGTVQDTRYKWEEKYIDPPRVFVFTNTLPLFDLLSADKWRYWTINDKQQLVPFTRNSLGDLILDKPIINPEDEIVKEDILEPEPTVTVQIPKSLESKHSLIILEMIKNPDIVPQILEFIKKLNNP